jgi:hypothetical protein
MSLAALLFVLLLIAGGLIYLRSHGRDRAGHREGGTPSSPEAAVDLDPLEGEWLRPENGAVLELSGVDRPGPVSIWTSGAGNASVSGASVRVVDGLLEVDFDYSDDAWSDCACRLTYDDSSDRLIGTCVESGGGRRAMVLIRR